MTTDNVTTNPILISYTTEYMMMIIVALCIIVGTIAMVAWKMRAEGQFKHFFGGIFMYAVFTACLKSISDMIIAPFFGISAWTYGLYDSLMWTILQVAGIYLGYKAVHKDHTDRRLSVSFGIGFGWAHIMLSAFISAAMYFAFAISVNDVGVAEMTANYTPTDMENFNNTLAYMQSLTVMDCIWAMMEVVARNVLLAAVSVIVFVAVKGMESRRNIAIAGCVLFVSQLPLSWSQNGTGMPLWTATMVLLLGTVGACVYAKRQYDELPKPRRYSRRTKYL